MGSFFVTGDAAVQRHAEIAERDRLHLERQTAQAEQIETVIRDAASDRDAAQLVAIAQLLAPGDWASRETWFDIAERSRGSNIEHEAAAYQRHRNMAALSVDLPLRKARQVLDLVRSWG